MPAPARSPVLQVGLLMPDLERGLQERYDAHVLPADADGAAALLHRDGAAARGVVVSRTPDVLTDCVADTAVGLFLDVVRGLSRADRFVRAGHRDHAQAFPLTRRVTGSRVGILGPGRIGTAIARRWEGFGVELGHHDHWPRDVPHRDHDRLLDLAGWSDVLVVAAGCGPGSAGLVDAAGLDVFAHEPQVPATLLDLGCVVLTPHLASGTVETLAAMVLDDVASFLAEGTVAHPVPA